MTSSIRLSYCLVALILLQTIIIAAEQLLEQQVVQLQEAHLHPDAKLFVPADDAVVLGPTSFPKPTDAIEPRGAVPIVLPAYGHHRPEVDAVFA